MPTTFGAVGTPVLAGFKSLESIAMAAAGYSDPTRVYKIIGEYVTLMHLPMSFILPIFLLGFMTRIFGANKSWMEGFRAWRYCLMASVCFLVPYMLLAWLGGPELPSMVGGLVGLGALVWLTRKGFCLPKDGVWNFPPSSEWRPDWSGLINASSATEYTEHMSQARAWLTGNAWPMLASFVGGLGAFITGSNTVSDMLFGNFQWNVATALNYSVPGHYIIVAAQGVGGAMGNMICIHNIVAVCAVLGMIGHEGPILRRTVVPFTIYGVVVGIVCFILLAGA